MPELKSIKLYGLAAEVQEKIDEASATVDEVRKISTFQTKQMLGLLTTSPTNNVLSKRTWAVRQQLVEQIKQLGVSNDQLRDATSLFDDAVEQALYTGLLSAARYLFFDQHPSNDQQSEFAKIMAGYQTGPAKDADSVRKLPTS